MYEELKSIENDLETLLIRMHNLQLLIKEYDLYIVTAMQLDIYIGKEEVQRLLGISDNELDILVANGFFAKIKVKMKSKNQFLLRDVIWLRSEGRSLFSTDHVDYLLAQRRAKINRKGRKVK